MKTSFINEYFVLFIIFSSSFKKIERPMMTAEISRIILGQWKTLTEISFVDILNDMPKMRNDIGNFFDAHRLNVIDVFSVMHKSP